MVVGHYSVSFAAKAIDGRIPLWLLFIAAQFVDVLWAAFVLFGIEQLRIVPGITASNPFDFAYMPYSHSVTAAVIWAAAAMLAYRAVRAWPGSATVVGLAVLAHWGFDLVMHRPDLPLHAGDGVKVGLGLWNYPAPALALEAALFFGALGWYVSRSTAAGRLGAYGFWLLGLVMFGIQAGVFFGPPLPSGRAVAGVALVSYALFAAVAHGLERQRRIHTAPESTSASRQSSRQRL